MLATIFVPLSVVLANLAGLIVQIVVPRCLSPAEYAQFAVLWSVGQFVNALFYEWQRFAVLRFSVGADADLVPKRRRALLWSYAMVSLGLAVVAVLSLVLGSVVPMMWSVAAVSFYAICQGTFEGRQSWARAEFDNKLFSSAWIMRTVLSMLGAIGVAVLTRSGAGALIGLAISYPITLLVSNLRRGGAVPRPSQPDWAQARFLLHYGLFAAASTIASSFLPAAVRAYATHVLPLTVTGGMLLALDMAQKALLVLGVAVNIVVMQQSIHAQEFGSDQQRARKQSLQIAVPFLLLLPAAVGFYMIQPGFAALLVSNAYRDVYLQNIGWGTAAAALLAFRLYAIDPLFVVAGRSSMSIFGPVVSLAVTFLWIIGIGAGQGYSAELVSQGTTVGMAAGGVAALVAVRLTQTVVWPMRDMLATVLAVLAMAAAIAVLPHGKPLVDAAIEVIVGGAVFAAAAVALDIIGLRGLIGQMFNRVRASVLK